MPDKTPALAVRSFELAFATIVLIGLETAKSLANARGLFSWLPSLFRA
jgi:hypothetical protein